MNQRRSIEPEAGVKTNPQAILVAHQIDPGMTEDYYALLGVDQEATEEAILQAYREKAAEHHPDVSEADNAESTFQRLHEAKDVLTDEQQRREYDRVGHERYVADSDTGRTSGQPSTRPRSRPDRKASSVGWPTGLGSLLEQFFRGPTAWTTPPESRSAESRSAGGRDPLVIDLEARLRGQKTASPGNRSAEDSGTGDASAHGRTECPRCKGRGRFVHDVTTGRGRTRRLERCERCGGSGAIDDPE